MSSVFFVKSVFIINSVYTDFVIMYNLLIHVLRSVVQGNYTVSRHCVHSMTLFLIGCIGCHRNNPILVQIYHGFGSYMNK